MQFLDSKDEAVLSVSQITSHIKELVETGFPDVWVSGEIVGFKRHSSGHIYFTLKDEGARLSAMIFRSRVRFLALRPEEMGDGVQLVCHGLLNLYEPHGAYKLIVDQVRPAGRGSLLHELEKLKARLASEGLFDESRKRELPFLPRTIGIVTSETSAAISDMLRIIEERFPSAVKLYPAAVQGETAAEEIVRGLRVLDGEEEVDVIIVGRGGGAFEDLLPFSDERVVRAVAACTTPVVSAVGHEIDYPLCDLAADRRAATPSAAGQMVVPDHAVLARKLAEAARQLTLLMERRLSDGEFELSDVENRLAELAERQSLQADARLSALRAGLAAAHPASRLERMCGQVESLSVSLDSAISRFLEQRSSRLQQCAGLLEQLGPTSQFKRGYSLVRRGSDGRAVRSYLDVELGEKLEIILGEGRLESEVTDRSA